MRWRHRARPRFFERLWSLQSLQKTLSFASFRILCSASPVEQRFIFHFRPGGLSGPADRQWRVWKSVSAQNENRVHSPRSSVLIPRSLTRHHYAVTMVHLVPQQTRSATELARTMSDQEREGGGLVAKFVLILKQPQ